MAAARRRKRDAQALGGTPKTWGCHAGCHSRKARKINLFHTPMTPMTPLFKKLVLNKIITLYAYNVLGYIGKSKSRGWGVMVSHRSAERRLA